MDYCQFVAIQTCVTCSNYCTIYANVKGIGEFMSIQELLEAAKNTQVTDEQISNLRVRLQEKADNKSHQSSSASKEFLARTYSL